MHTTISLFDISNNLGVMVTGGDMGRMLLVDPYAYGVLNYVEAHNNIPIIKLFIYESQ
jgi:hypothetical protein